MNSYINQIEDNNKINIKTENDLNKIINEDNILDTNTIYNITNTSNIDTNKEYNNINTTKTPKLMIEETTIKDDFNSVKFVGDELKEFKKLVLKFKNNLDCIHSNMKNRSMQDIVYNYYLNKNKTHNYIKKKNRRISDKEMNLIIDKEWTQEEKDIFHLKYPIFGKNVSKYQKFILKSIKDLRIYLLCYLKKIKKPEAKKFNKKDWSKDEQQLFAVFYSYYNKKWGNMVEHFPNKNKEDLKMYFNKYFKLLSVEEQRFETSLREYKLESRTDPVLHVKNKDRDYEYLELVGLLKRSVM
ncbi:hypothetical protein NAPIS_ORF01565 [Vairimorpha apis BRL 01]|uniref:Myb-like domain-containing protein n=1 Tax=Vairimorpha apis BRL 01 TaxID=1037528 RepID=T0MCH8_9MICR|nr:hypothetical protein NAPIS_ORF01565 [Vairimorpha apis BRL 01]